MSDHSRTLVPIESWAYQSPDLWVEGRSIDLGLFAEALIYYDKVIVNSTNEPQFAAFVNWFLQQGKFSALISLLEEGTIQIYHYAFATGHIHIAETGEYVFANVQDKEAAERDVFVERALRHPSLRAITRPEQRSRLRKALEKSVIEVKAERLGKDITENARQDFLDPDRSATLIQALVNEVFPLLGRKPPPAVTAKIKEVGEGKHRITWNVNLAEMSESLPNGLSIGLGIPGAAAAVNNKLLWSAADLNCDLYLGSPLSVLTGDKLAESAALLPVSRKRQVIEELVGQVSYPNIRLLVNEDSLHLNDILKVRKAAGRFRRWLQEEGERDRNALLAYHNEVARETGWTRGVRKALRLFGWLTPGLLGPAGSTIAGVEGAAAGAVVGGGIRFVAELAAKQNENWRPVVFGKWLEEHVDKKLRNRSRKPRAENESPGKERKGDNRGVRSSAWNNQTTFEKPIQRPTKTE